MIRGQNRRTARRKSYAFTSSDTHNYLVTPATMKSITKKLDCFAIAFFAFTALFAVTMSSNLRAQAPWLEPLFPPLEQPEAEAEEEPSEGGLLGTAFANLEALSVPSEKEALDKYSKGASNFEKMFEPLLADARQSLVKIRSTGASRSRRAKRSQIALGIVVSDKGWVLTKASELKGQLFCENASGGLVEARIFGLDPEYDLALLKVIDQDSDYQWQPANWAGPVAAITGDWLATPLDHEEDSHLGVVSVDSREIPPSKPFIGIYMGNATPTGITILEVQPKSPASECGLKEGDIILKLDDAITKDIEKLREQLEQCDAGDVVTLTVMRNERERKVKLTLANRDKVSKENMRSNDQNRMGSRLSGRRKNFPLAFQHDTPLQAKECGGPVVNLDGEVVGINVARAGRVASLAIPAHRVIKIVEQLGTGAYSPEIVNAKRIREVDKEIDETKKFVDQLGDRIEELMKSQTDSKQVLPGYQAAVEEMVNELNFLREKMKDETEDLEDSRREVIRIKRLIKDLKRERLRLETGVR